MRSTCRGLRALAPVGAAAAAFAASGSSALGRGRTPCSPARCYGQAPGADGKDRGSRQQFAAIMEFREKLRQPVKLPLVGIGVQLTDPTSTDALADCSDFIWYDQEHTPMSPEMLKWHIMVAHGKGVPAIVRVPGPNRVDGSGMAPWSTYIKHALDSNADGIAVPQIRTKEDVLGIVADCKYPTGGQRRTPYDKAQPSSKEMEYRFRRGFGPTTPMNYGRIPMAEYLERADRAIFVAVMIETVEAMENLDDICSVEGLDCVIIGANDLSGALGVPYQGEGPVTQAAVDKIIASAKRHGKYIFFSTRNPGLGMELVAKGVQILHVGSDVLASVSFQTDLVKKCKIK